MTLRMQKLVPLLCALMLCAGTAAASATDATYEYRILHPRYGDIGTYSNVVRQTGDLTEVSTELRVSVKVLGIVMYREEATRTEHWRGDRLVGFEGVTVTNGARLEVRGEAKGDNFVVTTPSGSITAPGKVHPSNPWARVVLETDMMMSTKSGRVDKVKVTGGNEEAVTFDGKSQRLKQFEIDGPKRQFVWFDSNNTVVAFRTEEDGAPIDFVLTRKAASASGRQSARH
jgi:hypothetical protein